MLPKDRRERSPPCSNHSSSSPRRGSLSPRPRLRKLIALIAGVACLLLLIFNEAVQSRTLFFLNSATPRQVKWLWNVPDNSKVRWTTRCPTVIPGVMAARWAGGWDTPRLRKPVKRLGGVGGSGSNGSGGENTRGVTTTTTSSTSGGVVRYNQTAVDEQYDLGPALLMLHVFSMPTPAARARRQIIRDHSPLLGIAEEYRHLVDFKFVLGYPKEECRDRVNEVVCPGVEEEERAIREEERYGDILRLDGLKGGENMDQGKTWEWIRHIGNGPREAQWVMKCDDDNLPILQNIVPFLFSLNPATPTYMGQAWLEGGDIIAGHYFMLGYMYGMNWGVIKTLATADVTPDEIRDTLFEDVRTGQLMLSLPPIPYHLRRPQRKYPPPKRNHYVDLPPPSTKTGLVRIDIRGYLSNYNGGDGYAGDRAFGWHNLKDNKLYTEAWERARKDLGEKRLVWRPPKGLEFLARDLD